MILKQWNRFKNIPGGKKLFSLIVGNMAPYTGTISPLVLHLEPGRSEVEVRENRKIRNHLKSVHAAALMNLAEMASGIAMLAQLPDHLRGIPVEFKMEYIKKARGVLRAKGRSDLPEVPSGRSIDHHIFAEIFDSSGVLVARGEATWKISERPK